MDATATVCLPVTEGTKVIESGKPAAESAGVKFVKNENGVAVYEVGSGRYLFGIE
jgi:alpha-L-rhamnosidase